MEKQHTALIKISKNSGHNSKILTMEKTIDDPDIIAYIPPTTIAARIRNKIMWELIIKRARRTKTNYDYMFWEFSEPFNYISTKHLLSFIPFKPDIIIVYSIYNFINAKNLYELNKITKTPIFWNPADMVALTGGCGYAWDCKGYEKNCGNCPAIYSKKNNDISSVNFKFKSKYIEKTDIIFISGSTWFTQKVKHSKLSINKRMEHIVLGIDNEIFKPLDKSIARQVFDIPLDKKVILTGAAFLSDKRKGIKYLIEALDSLANNMSTQEKEKIFLLIIGNNKNDMKFPFAHKHIGFLNDDRILALAYQAADVFVCPSIEDAGPMMIHESIMCGTPVVAFEMGVALDLVYTGETGYRAKLKDAEDLAKGIKEIISLNTESYNVMSKNCRELGLKLLHPTIQVNKYEKLFKRVSLSE